MNIQIHACSFASERYAKQQSLQISQLLDIGFTQERLHAHTPSILGRSFYEQIPMANESNKLGYYSFKPYFLGKVLRSMPAGDILLYLDVNDRPRPGIAKYLEHQFLKKPDINIICCGSNYPNIRHLSWYHKKNMSFELLLRSFFASQPEAGCFAVRNCSSSLHIINAWYSLTMLNAFALFTRQDSRSRHDQETLWALTSLCKSIRIESWINHRLFQRGLRNYVDFEHFRNA